VIVAQRYSRGQFPPQRDWRRRQRTVRRRLLVVLRPQYGDLDGRAGSWHRCSTRDSVDSAREESESTTRCQQAFLQGARLFVRRPRNPIRLVAPPAGHQTCSIHLQLRGCSVSKESPCLRRGFLEKGSEEDRWARRHDVHYFCEPLVSTSNKYLSVECRPIATLTMFEFASCVSRSSDTNNLRFI
jgi:hypothetical protein